MPDLYARACFPVHAVDGDTLDVMEDNGRREYAIRRERLLGINTPEMHDHDPALRAKAQAAKDFVAQWFVDHLAHNAKALSWPLPATLFGGYREVAYFILTSQKPDAFDRWLSVIVCQQGHELNQALLDAGLAVPYVP